MLHGRWYERTDCDAYLCEITVSQRCIFSALVWLSLCLNVCIQFGRKWMCCSRHSAREKDNWNKCLNIHLWHKTHRPSAQVLSKKDHLGRAVFYFLGMRIARRKKCMPFFHETPVFIVALNRPHITASEWNNSKCITNQAYYAFRLICLANEWAKMVKSWRSFLCVGLKGKKSKAHKSDCKYVQIGGNNIAFRESDPSLQNDCICFHWAKCGADIGHSNVIYMVCMQFFGE